MRILKFGSISGDDGGIIKNIEKIITETATQHRVIAVTEALPQVSDQLQSAAEMASKKDENYSAVLKSVENRHLELARQVLPVAVQSATLSIIKKSFNELEDICNGIYVLGELTPKTKDKIAFFGNYIYSKILHAALQSVQGNAEWLDPQALLLTNDDFTNANVELAKSSEKTKAFLHEKNAQIFIIPGNIGADEQGDTTTFGRAGADLSAAVLAAATDADFLEIWTDSEGITTADPQIVSTAKSIQNISYGEAVELSHFGAKNLYPPVLQPVIAKKIPLRLKNIMCPENAGTTISTAAESPVTATAAGISTLRGITLLTLEGTGMVGIPGFSARLFECLSTEKINIILITQSSSEHSISIAINQLDADAALQAAEKAFDYEIRQNILEPLKCENDLAIVALVGDKMKSRSGVSAKLFGALGNNGVNVRAIAQGSSEKNISVVISQNDVKKAVNVLHEEFFESEIKQIHLYICGTGNVGGKLIDQIFEQNSYLNENLGINLRISGIANSRKMLFSDRGLSKKEIDAADDSGGISDLNLLSEEIIKRNLRNSILVDVTANENVTNIYEKLLRKSISVVACNKIAAASLFDNYKKLKSLAQENSAKFFFETNVGAGLPVIGTINDLVRSGDKIVSIQAVLSGTLNFVFNNYDGTESFAKIVKRAQDEGFTEPDPRLDLAGTDVARKILILAREAGYRLEFSEIENITFLPQECMEGTVEDFYKSLEKYEDHFKSLVTDARSEGKIIKYVAEFKEGKAKVGLQKIAPDDDLYHLYGKDNIVILHTLRYHEQPLVIKGAGAGADVTASGVFADIVRTA